MKLTDLLNNTTTKRNTLKPAFNLGEIPTEQNFHEMIDGLFLIQGNTLYKDDTNGLGIQAGTDTAKPVLNFYDDPTQEPVWNIGIQNGFELKDTTGSSRLMVLNDGKVGVGTTTPEYALDLSQSLDSSTGLRLRIKNTALTGQSYSVLYLEGNTGADVISTQMYTDNLGTGNLGRIATYLGNFTNHDLGIFTSNTERLTIKDNGNIGIRTTNPDNTLTLDGTIGFYRNGAAPTASSVGYINYENYLTIGTHSSADGIQFMTGPSGSHTAKMWIANNGDIGIGTTAPESALHIQRPANGPAAFIIENSKSSDAYVGMSLTTHNQTWSFFSDRNIANQGIGIYRNSVGTGSGGGGYKLVVTGDGRVGIGTTNPTKAALEIASSLHHSNTGYMLAPNTPWTSVGWNTGIYTSGAIFADEIMAFSDQRIKEIIGKSDATEDLQTLNQIDIIDYSYRDIVKNGTKVQKKVIGQELAKVFPQAVSTNNKEFVPDIMQQAFIEDNWINIPNHDIKLNDKLKLIFEQNHEEVNVVEINGDKIKVDTQNTGKTFVYGREVDDFHLVDYDAVAMLNVSATQALTQKVAELEKNVQNLEELLATLQNSKANSQNMN